MPRILAVFLVPLVMLVVMLAGGFSAETGKVRAAQVASSTSKTVWDGVYTAEQAARGQSVFNISGGAIPQSACRDCHAEDLTGARGPALTGNRFMESWSEDSLSSLFTMIKTDMPRNDRGVLSDTQYLDIVAYIFQVNGFPAGTEELPLNTDAQKSIQIEGEDGPAPIADFSLVKAVGCLVQDPDGSWLLINVGTLFRSRGGNVSQGAALKDAEAVPLGTQTFNLLDTYTTPDIDAHKGQKVEAKGLISRSPEGERLVHLQPVDDGIHLSSLQTVASSCEH